jgi:cation-transporting ATPase E
MVSFLTIGAPGLFLSLAGNTTVARPGFIFRVLRFALPAGAIAAAATLLSYAAARSLVPNGHRTYTHSRDTRARRMRIRNSAVAGSANNATGQWFLLAALPMLLAIILASSSFREFFALELPPLSVWAATTLIVGTAAVSFPMTERSDRTDTRRGEDG